MGVQARFAKDDSAAALEALIDAKTVAVFCETIGNPAGNIPDLEAITTMAHKHGVPVIVDNTVPTPVLMKPIEFGADIVVHSLTKYMGGHGTSIGGIIVDSGKFPWAEHKDRFPMLSTPEPAYHGVVYTEALGPAAFIGRARTVPLRNMGSAISPFNAFLFLQGIETLSLRMEKHVSNTRKIVEFLAANSAVEAVSYPELPQHPDHELAKTLLPKGCGAVFSFNIKGNRASGKRFIETLKIFSHLANVGDAKSLVIHPASTTHFRMDEAALKAAGITEGTVRLSVGLENASDLIDDLSRALKASQKI